MVCILCHELRLLENTLTFKYVLYCGRNVGMTYDDLPDDIGVNQWTLLMLNSILQTGPPDLLEH